MKIRQAVISAAHPGHRNLPAQVYVDRDGSERTALEILLREVQGAGVERVALVVAPRGEEIATKAAGALADMVTLCVQSEPRGYADSLLCAESFVGDRAFLHLVADHLFLSTAAEGCAAQLVAIAEREACSVSAVQPTREAMLHQYGAVAATKEARSDRLFRVQEVIEKPTPTRAEQALVVPGLRAGHYLCLFGMHVFTPTLLTILKERRPEIEPLADALTELSRRERLLAFEVEGRRYNTGIRYGPWWAQLALALAGNEREEILRQLAEWLASRELLAAKDGDESTPH